MSGHCHFFEEEAEFGDYAGEGWGRGVDEVAVGGGDGIAVGAQKGVFLGKAGRFGDLQLAVVLAGGFVALCQFRERIVSGGFGAGCGHHDHAGEASGQHRAAVRVLGALLPFAKRFLIAFSMIDIKIFNQYTVRTLKRCAD